MPIIVDREYRDPAEINTILESLPDHTREKLESFRTADFVAWSLNGKKYEELKELNDELITANISLRSHQRNYADKPDPQGIGEELQKTVDRIKARMQEVQNIQPPQNLYPRVLEWAKALPVVARFEPHIADVPKGDPKELLERNRIAREDFLRERKELQRAPLDFEDAYSRAKQEIESLARKGAPNVVGLYHVGVDDRFGRTRYTQGTLSFPKQITQEGAYISEGGDKYKLDILAFIASLHQDAIMEKLEAALRDAQRPFDAISIPDRTAKIAEIDATLSELEYEEESIIMAAGYEIERRSNASIESVLQIRRIADAEAKPKSEPNDITDLPDGTLAINIGKPASETVKELKEVAGL